MNAVLGNFTENLVWGIFKGLLSVRTVFQVAASDLLLQQGSLTPSVLKGNAKIQHLRTNDSRRINGLSIQIDDFERKDMWGWGVREWEWKHRPGSVFLDPKQGDFAGSVHAWLLKATLPALHSRYYSCFMLSDVLYDCSGGREKW